MTSMYCIPLIVFARLASADAPACNHTVNEQDYTMGYYFAEAVNICERPYELQQQGSGLIFQGTGGMSKRR
jgi:hypothetical protein